MVILVKMVPVSHPALLNTAAGRVQFTKQDRLALFDYAATAQDYGVDYRHQLCSYANYSSGVASAAEQLAASIVFAPPFQSRWPGLARWQMWRLRRLVQRPLFALQTPDDQPVLSYEEPAGKNNDPHPTMGGRPATVQPF